jgi:DNA polymerase-3 subunit beta
MKFGTNKADFYQSLQRIIGVIPSKTTIPILGSILFNLEKGVLRLTGTDLEVSIITTQNVTGSASGAFTLSAKKTYDIIRELPEVPLEIEIADNFRVTISSDKGKYSLNGESSDEYPQISPGQTEGSFSYPLGRLLRMIETTQFAVSLDELRTTLMGVLLELRERELRTVATDGHRLVRMSDLTFVNKDRPMQVIIPTKALHLLTRLSEQQQTVDIAIGESHIVFKTEHTTILSKLITGQFPNYERVIPSDNQLELVVERDVLAAAVRRVSLFANQTTQQVRLAVSRNALTVQAEDEQIGGEAKESIPATFDGEQLEIGYNSQYLLEVLRHIDTPEVLFQLKDGGSAAIVRPAAAAAEGTSGDRAGEDQLMLLMPIRLNDAPQE